ncbi:hypothetical protein Bpfe_018672 [Biomphalaria pfeifferi]|uniref:Uncharacterized protein n=1 Tax=Biomphalaria pfeifferi TaxID=112525 RepID=A0AAD8F4Y5_BIOPF|nr:hypothetical protein Bpfe_018672 [Biomphalaria pfeifferi]
MSKDIFFCFTQWSSYVLAGQSGLGPRAGVDAVDHTGGCVVSVRGHKRTKELPNRSPPYQQPCGPDTSLACDQY